MHGQKNIKIKYLSAGPYNLSNVICCPMTLYKTETCSIESAGFNKSSLCLYYTFFSMALPPILAKGFLITEASGSHSDAPHSLGLLWTSDQSEAETST